MLVLQVIEGHNKIRIATVRKKGIRYRGRLLLPVSMERLDGGAAEPSGPLGAAVGAIALGAAGAIVGSMVGSRGRTSVLIKTADGDELVCTVASHEFPGLYVEVRRLMALSTTGYLPPPPGGVRAKHVFLGPFYFLKFGLAWFACAIGTTVLTMGLAWLVLPAIAAYLDRRRARALPQQVLANEILAPSGNKFIWAETDLLPSDEGGTATP